MRTRSLTAINRVSFVSDAMRHLPTSDEDKFSNGFANKVRHIFALFFATGLAC